MSHIDVDSAGATLIISDSAAILDDCHTGDSIAVNGCWYASFLVVINASSIETTIV